MHIRVRLAVKFSIWVKRRQPAYGKGDKKSWPHGDSLHGWGCGWPKHLPVRGG